MPDIQKNKKCFSTDDFSFSQPYIIDYVSDEYDGLSELPEYLEYGFRPSGGPGERDEIIMPARFKYRSDENLIDGLLGLNPQAGESVSRMYVSWYGDENNLPSVVAVVYDDDLCERHCTVPLEEGSSEKLMGIINHAIEKTDLERFCDHLDSLGEKWSFTDDSKTCIECTYLNGGEPYQVRADGYYLLFEHADNFMFDRNTAMHMGIEEVRDQEEKMSASVTEIQTDKGRTLTVHDIGSKNMLVSENGKNPQWCGFTPDINGNAVIGVKFGDDIDIAHFRAYLELDNYCRNDVLNNGPVDIQIIQEGIVGDADNSVNALYTENFGKNVAFKVYAVDENMNALIGGSWYGIPMEAVWISPEHEYNDPSCDIGYDISGLSEIYIDQDRISKRLNPERNFPEGVYKPDKESMFIVHDYGIAENGHATALISEQKDGQVLSAKWCRCDAPAGSDGKGSFRFEKDGKDVLIPSDKIKPYREPFTERFKRVQKAAAERSSADIGSADKQKAKETAL